MNDDLLFVAADLFLLTISIYCVCALIVDILTNERRAKRYAARAFREEFRNLQLNAVTKHTTAR